MSPAAEALAGQLDALSRQLRLHGEDLVTVRALAEAATRVLDDLVERIDQVEHTASTAATRLAEHLAAGDRNPRCWSWLAEPDPKAVVRLADWMGRVLLHYPTTPAALSPCWPWHPWAVEELLALHRSWTEAYIGATASGLRAVDWHERHRPGVLTRIGRTLADCDLAAHHPGARADHTHQPALAGAAQIDQATAWWATQHEGQP